MKAGLSRGMETGGWGMGAEDSGLEDREPSDGQAIRLQTGPSGLSWAAFTIIEGRFFW